MKPLLILLLLCAPALADALRGPGGISTPNGETEVGRYTTTSDTVTIMTTAGTTTLSLTPSGGYVGPDLFLMPVCLMATSEGCWLWAVYGFMLIGGDIIPLPQTEFVKDSP